MKKCFLILLLVQGFTFFSVTAQDYDSFLSCHEVPSTSMEAVYLDSAKLSTLFCEATASVHDNIYLISVKINSPLCRFAKTKLSFQDCPIDINLIHGMRIKLKSLNEFQLAPSESRAIRIYNSLVSLT
jgi:hypothetical protein